MSYKTIQYGSSGDDVKKLQEELNKHGYKLDVDGQFGTKTQTAVKDYQRKNNLDVDGIVGENTWGSLFANTNTTTKNQNRKNAFEFNTKRPTYEKSDEVKNAEEKLSDWEKNAPDEYESKHSAEIEAVLNDILNREEFTYNLNADPLYQQYKELYTQNGKKAMMDTVGEASALTGGYANSYAVTAGNQAYHEYLNNLNGIALDLRDRAYEQYGDESERLFEEVKLLRSLDGDDYEKYLDRLERYYKDGEYLLDKLTSMSDAEYEHFLQTVDAWESDRDFAFKEYTDTLDREEFEKEMAFKIAEAERDQLNADREYDLALQRLYATTSGDSDEDDKDKDDKTINYPESYEEFCLATGYPGILTEVEYLSHDAVREKYSTYKKYLKAMYKKYK